MGVRVEAVEGAREVERAPAPVVHAGELEGVRAAPDDCVRVVEDADAAAREGACGQLRIRVVVVVADHGPGAFGRFDGGEGLGARLDVAAARGRVVAGEHDHVGAGAAREFDHAPDLLGGDEPAVMHVRQLGDAEAVETFGEARDGDVGLGQLVVERLQKARVAGRRGDAHEAGRRQPLQKVPPREFNFRHRAGNCNIADSGRIRYALC